MSTWQPIEKAPKDGSYVIVWPPTYRGAASCARWYADQHATRPRPFWTRTDSDRITTSRDRPPTHWMPIPPPPTDSQGEGR